MCRPSYWIPICPAARTALLMMEWCSPMYLSHPMGMYNVHVQILMVQEQRGKDVFSSPIVILADKPKVS